MIPNGEEFYLYPTSGSSMFPFIRGNEYILIKRVPAAEIRMGDVIVIESKEGGNICHRLVKRGEKEGVLWLQTKGDRNEIYDPPVTAEALIGKVIAIRRKEKLVRLSGKRWEAFLDEIQCFSVLTVFAIKRILKNMLFSIC
jgi:signal peptidase I